MDRESEWVRPRDACGVFGVFGHPSAAELTYYGLYALQHRGQESAGIVSTVGNSGVFRVHRGMGLVSQVFNEEALKKLAGDRAIGHVRYSTMGSSEMKNAQPIVIESARGTIALGHNGNLVNAQELREELEGKGSIFQTTTDSEIILHLISQPESVVGREGALLYGLRRIQGAFSLVMMTRDQIIGVRDPQGFRPLCLGRLDQAWILSSESCALDLIGASLEGEIEPGEIVVIDERGVRRHRGILGKRERFCIFEYIYFSRPDSVLCGKNVSEARVQMGRYLARAYPVEADVVVPIPDSGNYAALGYSEESGIPFSMAFVRNHYIGRTFLQPSKLIRDFSVRVKLNLIEEAVAGKRVVVIDDSIVRGTTAKARIVNLRKAGAKEVHVRVSCPPHRFACHYGIDFPDPRDLIANQMTLEAIANYLGADSLGYLNEEDMISATGLDKGRLCRACFDGDYPVPVGRDVMKEVLEGRGMMKGGRLSGDL
ncbi:MAG: amidophosphoribosyltransferase [Methylacidiphilales bacterium]|nr:amidophosphoribosyltransferase [Candidatus Methylacidiphilales bacterium]MDW8350092.1 amidophosphoribosyltransferase [Verrucomicrobiae bacterium]